MKFWKILNSGSMLVIALIGVLSALFMWSCYPDSGLTSIADHDVIITQYDTKKDFSTFVTYFLVDSIEHIVPEGEEDKITREFDQQILDRVAKNMNDLNYQRITDTTGVGLPNLALKVSVTTTTYQGWTYYPGWWGGWWGGYPPGWGPWYPPGYVVPTQFSTGSVLIDMLDMAAYIPEPELVPVIWIAGISGLLGDSRTNTAYRLDRDIDQSFNQSPYLGR
jgi:hypothetical protein